MAVVYVNDKAVDIGDEKLNAIQAAQKAGVFIPHYCWHPALTVVASCRMCLVEIGDRQEDGSDRMMPKVVPGCQTPVKHNSVIKTNTDKATFAQEQTLESLLLNHPLDCPVCDKAGECLLQDYSYEFGRSTSRMIDQKRTPPNKPDISDKITLFTDRCIMCSRCVRFTREISGEAELQVINRGDHAEIGVFPGKPVNNKLALNVVDLCPVGALGSKDFLYTQRVWFLDEKPSVCPDCSTGCSIHVDSNKNIIYRLRPRENPQSQGYFMCDEGRLGYPYVNSPDRIGEPLVHGESGLTASQWEFVMPQLRRDLSAAISQNADRCAAVLSPFQTVEEAFLLAKLMKDLSPETKLFLGPVPVVGDDDTYPKDRKGRATDTVKFTIRAEKCPNRLGVEAVLKHFEGEVKLFSDFVNSCNAKEISAAYVVGGYPPRSHDVFSPESVSAMSQLDLLVVQDMFASAITQHAKYVLPASSYAEKDGTFVNHAELAQPLARAIRPPKITRTDGQILMELAQRRGLFHAPSLRKEIALTIPYFSALEVGDLGEFGVRLGLTSLPVTV